MHLMIESDEELLPDQAARLLDPGCQLTESTTFIAQVCMCHPPRAADAAVQSPRFVIFLALWALLTPFCLTIIYATTVLSAWVHRAC